MGNIRIIDDFGLEAQLPGPEDTRPNEFRRVREQAAKSHYRANQTMNYYVEAHRGHDDFLMSLALLVEAGNGYVPREARGRG